MSREYPDWISPNRAAEGKRIFSGTIPLKRMKRLAALLDEVRGEAAFTASFRTDLDQRIIIVLQVEASLPLVCQASLDVYDEQVRLYFLERIRDEQTFLSTVQLMAQIRQDVEATRSWYRSTPLTALTLIHS